MTSACVGHTLLKYINTCDDSKELLGVYCKKCDTEWIKDEMADTGNSATDTGEAQNTDLKADPRKYKTDIGDAKATAVTTESKKAGTSTGGAKTTATVSYSVNSKTDTCTDQIKIQIEGQREAKDTTEHKNMYMLYDGIRLKKREKNTQYLRYALEPCKSRPPRKGDHIIWYRGHILSHHGIVVDVNDKIEIMEFGPSKCSCEEYKCNCCKRSCTGKCCYSCSVQANTKEKNDFGVESTCWGGAWHGEPYVAIYPSQVTTENPSELVVARAKAMENSVGFNWRGYDLVQNNCEHFSTFCTSGSRQSKQARGVAWIIAHPISIILVRLLVLGVAEAVENFALNQYPWLGSVIAICLLFIFFFIQLVLLCCECKKHNYKDCAHVFWYIIMQFIFEAACTYLAGYFAEKEISNHCLGKYDDKTKRWLEFLVGVIFGFVGSVAGIVLGKSLNQFCCNLILYTKRCYCSECCNRKGYEVKEVKVA